MEKVIDINKYKKAILVTSFVMLGIVLPQIFHLFGLGGNKYLPMHIPVILIGFLLGHKYGFITGLLSPIISTALTGMPSEFPMMPIMVCELGAYGIVSGILSKKTKLPTIASLIITMLVGRISYAVAYSFIKIFFLPTIPVSLSVRQAVITGLPGIVLQLILITAIVMFVKKKGLIND